MNTNRYYRRDGHVVDADEALDDGVLRDGFTARVPMMLRDSVDRMIRQNGLHDGRGNLVGHRPGYIVDASRPNADAIAEAYRLRDEEDRNAWRRGPVHDGKKITQRDPSGRLMSVLEEEEDDDERLRDAMVRDGSMTLDQIERVHHTNMSKIYADHDAWLREQWRTP